MTSLRPQHPAQRMIGLRGPAMLLLAAAALAVLPAPAAAVKAISPFSEGIITHFGGAQDGEQGWGRLLGGWRVRTCGGGGTGGGARAASWWRQRWNKSISAASLLVDGHSPMGCCRAVAVGVGGGLLHHRLHRQTPNRSRHAAPPAPRVGAGMDPSSLSFGTKEGACGFGVIPKDK